MYKMTVVLATPDVSTDEDFVYPLEFSDKKGMNKVESAFLRGIQALTKITEEEIKTGKKAFPKSGPGTLVTFDVKIHDEDGYFGGYHFDWPRQQPEAVVYLRGMLDGIMKETGHGNAKQRRPKK